MFNPFKYQYQATFLSEEGSEAILKVQNGANEYTLKVPRAFVPSEVSPGQSFSFTLQPQESANQAEFKSMRRLLEELVG